MTYFCRLSLNTVSGVKSHNPLHWSVTSLSRPCWSLHDGHEISKLYQSRTPDCGITYSSRSRKTNGNNFRFHFSYENSSVLIDSKWIKLWGGTVGECDCRGREVQSFVWYRFTRVLWKMGHKTAVVVLWCTSFFLSPMERHTLLRIPALSPSLQYGPMGYPRDGTTVV